MQMAVNTPERTRELLNQMHALLLEIGNPQAIKDIFVTAMHKIEQSRSLPDDDEAGR